MKELLGQEYKDVQEIGSGAFGTVLRANRRGTTVAVKAINLKSTNVTRSLVLKEIQIHREMLHENIVRFKHSFCIKHVYFLVMEYCDGGTLQNLKDRGLLPEAFCRRMLYQLTQAIQYLYSMQVTHFDIKPSNILLTKRPLLNVKLCDFGVSLSHENGAAATGTRGTYRYMAPEVMFSKNFTPAADLWSLGMVMYECLHGCHPLTQLTIAGIRKHLIDKQTINVPQYSDVSDEGKDVLAGLLVAAPVQRMSLQMLVAHPYLQLDPLAVKGVEEKTLQLINEGSALMQQRKFDAAFVAFHEALQYSLPRCYIDMNRDNLLDHAHTLQKYIRLAKNAIQQEQMHLVRSNHIRETDIELAEEADNRRDAPDKLRSLCNLDSNLAATLAAKRSVEDALAHGMKSVALKRLMPAMAELLTLLSVELRGHRRRLLRVEVCRWMKLGERIKEAMLQTLEDEITNRIE